MKLGLALPQFPFSVAPGEPFDFTVVLEHARRARDAGYDSVWLADHLVWDVAKYGGPPDREPGIEPLAGLAAIATAVPDVEVGTLVLCEALRAPAVLARAVATLHEIAPGRVHVGLGAGWYEPDYAAIGIDMPPPGERLDRLARTLDEVRDRLSAEGVAVPLFAGGRGDRFLTVVAAHADGWNTCWNLTPAQYRERLGVLETACAAIGRDRASVSRSLGLYALCGTDERDLEARFARLQRSSPPGVLDGVSLDEWREGRLVGTVEEVRGQCAAWEALGVETLILSAGGVPFHVGDPDDVDALGAALRR
jgi:alkanesulfonate monooxygenase SsuD/methylene tetrahydromethanopterin reductase-like flavin-dependent oxidoreductase (luciferase family)